MRIVQITSKVTCGPAYVGKWYCADSTPGTDGDPIIRYLQHDGTWGKNTQYFDNKPEVQTALDKGHQPDFTVDKQEQHDRNLIREMAHDAARQEDEWNDIASAGNDYPLGD